MDTIITYAGAIPLDTDLPSQARQNVRALGAALQLVMGTGFCATGLGCSPAPSGLGVVIAPGSLIQNLTLAPVASGSLASDGTTCIQQGINDDSVALTFPGAGTWTVYATVEIAASGAVVLPFYNSANPSQVFAGPGNSGSTSPTKIVASVGLGVTTGSVPSGSVALYTVTIPNGSSSVTSSMIAIAADAPFHPIVPDLAPKDAPIFTTALTAKYGPSQSYRLALQGSDGNAVFSYNGSPTAAIGSAVVTFSVPTKINSTLGVSGDVGLGSALSVTGTANFSSTIGVSGTASFGSNVGVTGNMGAGSISTIGAAEIGGQLTANANQVLVGTLSIGYGTTPWNGDANSGYNPIYSYKNGVFLGVGGLSICNTSNPPLGLRSGVGGGALIQFYGSDGPIGAITNNGNSSVSYNTTSDYRLKTNVIAIDPQAALADVMRLRPVSFSYIGGGGQQQGFLAHELAKVIPHAVTGAKDATDEHGRLVAQLADYSKTVATLTAAIQALSARLVALESRA
jgi:Chaperone of endosialidase